MCTLGMVAGKRDSGAKNIAKLASEAYQEYKCYLQYV